MRRSLQLCWTLDNHARISVPIAAGTVVSVTVSPGDTVEAGDELAVIEAMKMRNSIKADVGGSISQVLVAGGAVVQADQLLIKFT